jgi:hypothetical protein
MTAITLESDSSQSPPVLNRATSVPLSKYPETQQNGRGIAAAFCGVSRKACCIISQLYQVKMCRVHLKLIPCPNTGCRRCWIKASSRTSASVHPPAG